MRTIFLVGGLLVCLACVFGALYRCTQELSRKQSASNEKIAAVRTFNDVSLFKVDPKNPRRFIFVNDSKAGEAYLRFRIPDFTPSDYKLSLCIRANPSVLNGCVVRTAKSVLSDNRGVVKGDIATYVIDMNDADTFMWSDKACYVGVSLPKFLLKLGDVVELVDFKFQLR